MAKLYAFINGVGLIGPGFDNWPQAQPILAGSTAYMARPVAVPMQLGLPRSESRRIGITVKVGLAVAQEAVAAGQLEAKQLACVFCSSGGDGDSCHAICQTLASADRQLSPTRFHNSVHNAAVGYWGIAVAAMTPATMLCAYDGSFSAGLLEALAQVRTMGTGVLLVNYDVPYPEPLYTKRPCPAIFGLALTLLPQATLLSQARIEIDLTSAPATTLANAQLEALRRNIPSARGLPLLQALVQGGGAVVLDYLEPQGLAVRITPCR